MLSSKEVSQLFSGWKRGERGRGGGERGERGVFFFDKFFFVVFFSFDN